MPALAREIAPERAICVVVGRAGRVRFGRTLADVRECLGRSRPSSGPIDLVIDDASHIDEATLASFEVIFPRLKAGGLFIIRDCAADQWRQKWVVMGHTAACGEIIATDILLSPISKRASVENVWDTMGSGSNG